jgi:uncharacterized membrane protein YozB (DUF420 family)
VIEVADLPHLNAALNGTCAVLLVAGWTLIKTGRRRAHVACMVAALLVSGAFLASYLTYHAHVGSKKFPGQGWIRAVYFTILLTHTVLAAVALPMAIVTAWRGWKNRLADHVRLARWTLPIWLYVSITGVVIYAMLYRSPYPLQTKPETGNKGALSMPESEGS